MCHVPATLPNSHVQDPGTMEELTPPRKLVRKQISASLVHPICPSETLLFIIPQESEVDEITSNTRDRGESRTTLSHSLVLTTNEHQSLTSEEADREWAAIRIRTPTFIAIKSTFSLHRNGSEARLECKKRLPPSCRAPPGTSTCPVACAPSPAAALLGDAMPGLPGVTVLEGQADQTVKEVFRKMNTKYVHEPQPEGPHYKAELESSRTHERGPLGGKASLGEREREKKKRTFLQNSDKVFFIFVLTITNNRRKEIHCDSDRAQAGRTRLHSSKRRAKPTKGKTTTNDHRASSI